MKSLKSIEHNHAIRQILIKCYNLINKVKIDSFYGNYILANLDNSCLYTQMGVDDNEKLQLLSLHLNSLNKESSAIIDSFKNLLKM